MKSVLLYSGGMDSWLISKIIKPDVKLFVDLGTNSTFGERRKLDKDVIIVDFKELGLFERKETDFILPLRNLYLIALATNYGEHIYLGANATDQTYDKTEQFASKLEDLLNYMWLPQKWTKGKEIKVDVSFREYTKSQLLGKYLEMGGTWQEAYEKTFSCYTPINGKECHSCRPCFLKFMAFEDNNITMPLEIVSQYVPYIREKILDVNYVDRLYSKDTYKKVLSKYGYDIR